MLERFLTNGKSGKGRREPDVVFFAGGLCGGGIEKSTVNLTRFLASKGYRVDILLIQAKGVFLDRARNIKGANVIDLDSTRGRYAIPKLVTYLKEVQPPIIFSQNGPNSLVMILSKMVSGVSTNLVACEHNALSKRYQTSPTFKKWLFKQLRKLLYDYPDQLLAISNGVARDLKKTLGKSDLDIEVIYNPVIDDELHDKKEETNELRGMLDENRPNILTAGRLVAQKDHKTLIRAFDMYSKSNPAQLIILGKGELRSELENFVNRYSLTERIHFPGFVQNPFPMMKAADVFVLSSRHEGFGNVLPEAMACGTPVVSTNCLSGPSEILQDGEYGELVPIGDPESMAMAIEKVVENPPPEEKLLKRSSDFRVEKIGEEYLKLIKKLK